MENDRELLEWAAIAAGIEGYRFVDGFEHLGLCISELGYPIKVWWNPLAEDGDALLLAVKLGISVTPYPIYQPDKHSVITKQRRVSDTLREANPTEVVEVFHGDPYAATRRAITRAAAQIGKEMNRG